MLEKLAKQTAVYGISTIAVRFLSYLLTPYYTREFGQEDEKIEDAKKDIIAGDLVVPKNQEEFEEKYGDVYELD